MSLKGKDEGPEPLDAVCVGWSHPCLGSPRGVAAWSRGWCLRPSPGVGVWELQGHLGPEAVAG